MKNDPQSLLTEYARHGSEEAFRELVRRYSDLVYSAALRQADGDHHYAEDIVQKVFTDLAVQVRQGRGPLAAETVQLGGWLHHHTCLVAANHRRATQRRRAREHAVAHGQINDSTSESQDAWTELETVLDQALDVLPAQDRAALVLRFLERHPLRDLGSLLGIGEDAAQKRVSRALDRLRAELLRRGVAVSVGVLAVVMDDRTAKATPAGLVDRIARQVADASRPGAELPAVSTSHVSLMGSLAAWFIGKPASFLAVAGLGVLAVLVWLGTAVSWRSQSTVEPPASAVAARTETDPSNRAQTGADESRAFVGAGGTEAGSAASSPVIRFSVVAAKDGRPIPNASVSVTAMKGERTQTQSQLTDASGIAEVHYPVATDRMIAITRTENYADLLLTWEVRTNAAIPESYEVRLEDGVAVGGSVVSEAGDPVFNARVQFHADFDGDGTSPTRRFACFLVPVLTDVTGHWVLRGIPEWLLDRLQGTASMTDGQRTTRRAVDGDPRVRAELLGSTFRFVMATGWTVKGEVVDPSGAPVVDAEVRVLSASNFGGPSKKTSADGTFSFENCESGTNLITVQTAGWAPRTMVAVAGPQEERIRVAVSPGRSLRLQVTGPTGSPAAGVSVRLDSMPPEISRRATDPSVTRADFAARTDIEGRVAWDAAPDEDLTLVIGEFGDWAPQRLVLRPSEREHAVRLSLPSVTSGTGVDTSTGTPNPLGEPRESGTILKFEVRGPEGQPAGHAEVVAVNRRESPALLAPDGLGGLLRDRMVRASDEGTVSLPTDVALGSEVVVLAHHQSGMALATASEVASSRLLKLRAWSKIEGRLLDRTRPRSGVTADLEGDSNDPQGRSPMLERFSTSTDGEGRFEFPRVPPGRLRLSFRDQARSASMSDADGLDLPIEAEPGKVARIEIGADHRPIQLRLAEPAILVLLTSAADSHGPNISLRHAGRGRWTARFIPPGRYRLAVLPGEAMTPTTDRELKFVGEFEVPPSSTGERFDAGEFGTPTLP
ncbi:MAG: sigma-70 family RNA polymerase sigma factor [Verrucomicrobiales bacterium]|nr:sigma-70 family RNA polymerase sigma factor [Verrucomicrobiales bacterium]